MKKDKKKRNAAALGTNSEVSSAGPEITYEQALSTKTRCIGGAIKAYMQALNTISA